MDNRRNPNPETKSYQMAVDNAEDMWAHHSEICRLVASSNGGFTNEHIAKLVGCTPQTVSNVRNSILGKQRIAELSNGRDESAMDISEKVREIAPVALKLMETTINKAQEDIDEGAPDMKLLGHGLRAAHDVADYSIPKETKQTVVHGHITYQQIQDMKKRIEEKRMAAAIPVAVSVEESS